MSRFYIAKGSSAVNAPFGVGVSRSEAKNRNIIVHGYSVASRGADFAADVQIDLMPGYTALGSELAFTGVESLGTAIYDSSLAGAFDTDTDDWAELTNNGEVLSIGDFTDTVGAGTEYTDCLKVLADGGGDLFDIKRAATTVNNGYYKVTFLFAQETGAGLSYLMLGDANANDAWNEVFDHDLGNHATLGAEDTWAEVTLYGKADGTTIEISATTGKNNTTQDTLGAGLACYFKDIKVYTIVDANGNGPADWVPQTETDMGWDGNNASWSCDAGAGGALTYTDSTGWDSGDIIRVALTQSTYIAQNITVAIGGDSAITVPAANGSYVYYGQSDGTDTVIIDADGTADCDVSALSVKKLTGMSTDNSIYHHTIQSGDVQGKQVPFPCPMPIGSNGFWMQFTPGGASSILDVNVFYQIV